MSDVGMRADVQSVLAQMRVLQAQAQQGTDTADVAGVGNQDAKPKSEFAAQLEAAAGRVNELQNQSGELSSAFVRGETDDLVSVMIAGQKAKVAFQGLVHTRNQLVNAYQEIMKMTI
ncbi:MAG: flagellar hook-basal body complex protein FliE [Pseudomonadota bacterium]